MTLLALRSLLAAAALLCFAAPVNSFLYNPTVNPDLNTFAQAQLGKLLKIQLDIGLKKTAQQRIALQGPIIKLTDTVRKTLRLPGANGPTPQISTGSKSVEVVKDGFVIDMNGSRTIPFQDGCWEMVWKDGARHGVMVCGFKLPEPIKRNAFSFPACDVFMSFPVWSEESLAAARVFKEEVLAQRQTFVNEKRALLDEYQAEKNLFQKGILYHKAAQAHEKAFNTPRVSHIPDVGETIELSSGLIMTKKGSIFNREPGFGGAHQELGVATVSLAEPEVVES